MKMKVSSADFKWIIAMHQFSCAGELTDCRKHSSFVFVSLKRKRECNQSTVISIKQLHRTKSVNLLVFDMERWAEKWRRPITQKHCFLASLSRSIESPVFFFV